MSEHLKTAAALLPLISVGVAGISAGDLDVALFIIGVVYVLWFIAAVVGGLGWASRRALQRHWTVVEGWRKKRQAKEERGPTEPTRANQLSNGIERKLGWASRRALQRHWTVVKGWRKKRQAKEERGPTEPTRADQLSNGIERKPADGTAIDELAWFWIFYVGFLLAIAFVIAWAYVSSDHFNRTANDFGVPHALGIFVVALCALAIGPRFAPGGPQKTQSCPDCAEKISAQAVKCKHCGARVGSPTSLAGS